MRIESLRREFDLQVRWSVFPLHPHTPEGGMDLHDLFAGQIDIEAMLARLRDVAADLGLPFGDRSKTYNSRRAQELGKWAEASGRGEAFHRAVYRACFVAGSNITREEVLVTVAGEAGLDPEAAREVLRAGSYAAAVEADWRRAEEFGVTAVPTVIRGDRRLVGFRPYAAYRELVAANGKGRE